MAFVPQAPVFGLIDFFPPGHMLRISAPATHRRRRPPRSGLRSRSSVYIYLVPLSGEKYSSGSHVVTRISKSPLLLVSDRCWDVR